MKLRNKKTGEIVIFGEGIVDLNKIGCKNVAEMMETGWEDYEEPKDSIDYIGLLIEDYNRQTVETHFDTPEEVEKAVEKLKAWKRLKDSGFKRVFNVEVGDGLYAGKKVVSFKLLVSDKDLIEDIKLLFGGEE